MSESAVNTTMLAEVETSPPTEPRRRGPWKIVVVVVALSALAVGLGLLVAHDASTRPALGGFQPSRHADPSQLDFRIGDVPAGWTEVKAVGAAQALPPQVLPDQTLNATASYGTHGDPTAPRIWLTHGDEMVSPDVSYLDSLEAVDRQTFTVDSRSAECGRIDRLAEVGAGSVQVWCYLDTAQQRVFAAAEGFDVTQMVTVLQTLTLPNGEPRLDVGALPSGTSLLRHARKGVEDVWAASGVEYRGPKRAGATLTVAWDDEIEFGDTNSHAKGFVKVDVNGHVGYLADNHVTGTTMLFWYADGKAFRLEARDTSDVLAMARSVHPAT